MSGWRLALRIARREALRHKGRSALVAAMIALPVAGAGTADTVWHSAQVTRAQSEVYDMGRYDAMISYSSMGPLTQSPDGTAAAPDTSLSGVSAPGAGSPGGSAGALPGGGSAVGGSTADDSAAALTAVRGLLPAGSKVSAPVSTAGQLLVAHGHGRIWTTTRDLDLADPLTAGMYLPKGGRAPAARGEAAISAHLAHELGKGVGDTITVTVPYNGGSADSDGAPIPAATLTVTGLYEDPRSVRDDQVFQPSGAPGADPAPHYLISVPGGVSWDLVRRMNAVGFTVESKAVLADPPPDSAVPFYVQNPRALASSQTLSSTTATAAAVAVAMILLEVVLLAGPAFAVSARRRRRDFGLLGAAGADGRRLRRIVLADGLVLGLAGGVAGVVAGVAAGGALLPWVPHFSDQEPGGFRVAPLELAGAAAVGVLTGLVAALAPALTTARLDVLAALTGRRGQVAAPWKLPVLGLAGIGLGVGLLFYGALSGGGESIPMIIGICLAEIGVVACTPVMVAWSGRLARFLPLAGRLALRDGARNRGRTAPAVAAVMAAVAGASAMAVVLASDQTRGRAEYQAMVRNGVATVWLNQTDVDPATLIAKVDAQVPVRQAGVLSSAVGDVGAVTMVRSAADRCPDDTAGATVVSQDPRCDVVENGVSEGGPAVVDALIGRSDPAVVAALAAGGAVVFDPLDLATPAPHATVRLEADPMNCPPLGTPGITADCEAGAKVVTVPGAVVAPPTAMMLTSAIAAPGVLEKLGLHVQPNVAFFDTSRMPTAAESKKADDVLGDLGIMVPFYVEHGYEDSVLVVLLALAAIATVVTLGAAAVATGLAITDAQSDLETLAAIGARPRVRRTLAGAQAAVIAGLGAVLGALFGIVPAGGLLEARAQGMAKAMQVGGMVVRSTSAYLTVPWAFLALVVLVPPVLAAAGASGLTRSRIVMLRRRT